VQHHAADHLHVEVAHAEHTVAGFADHGKGFGQQGIQRFAVGDALAKLGSLGRQLLIAEQFQPGLQLVDADNNASILAQQPLVATAENLLEEAGDHSGSAAAWKPQILTCGP
jgi:hypothetical protein